MNEAEAVLGWFRGTYAMPEIIENFNYLMELNYHTSRLATQL